jgi:predicted nucleic acid-binding protein
MHIFFDTSALAKRYIDEVGSATVAMILMNSTEIILSSICISELISAFNRLLREKKISKATYQELKRHFFDDLEQATVMALSTDIIKESIHCLERTPLRAMDALHIASAILANCDLFVSADQQQITAAKKLGLKTALV